MIKYGIFALSNADIRFDFALSTRAHRSVNSFARKDFTIPSGRDGEVFTFQGLVMPPSPPFPSGEILQLH